MTLYMLDTNIASAAVRGDMALDEKLARLSPAQWCISAITRAELRYGQTGMAPDDRRRPLIDSFFLRLPSLEWSVEAADIFGTLKDRLKRGGTPIGELDTQIAAHALAEDLILVTHNTKHFDKVPGLKLEDWMA